MTVRSKKRVLVTALVLFALWPLVHHAAVVRFELNPWKFFGWSMYCTPPNKISVEMFASAGDEPQRLDLARAPAPLRGALGAFVAVRAEFGDFARPHIVARALFQLEPRFQSVRIVVYNLRLVPGSDTFEPQESVYTYRRP